MLVTIIQNHVQLASFICLIAKNKQVGALDTYYCNMTSYGTAKSGGNELKIFELTIVGAVITNLHEYKRH